MNIYTFRHNDDMGCVAAYTWEQAEAAMEAKGIRHVTVTSRKVEDMRAKGKKELAEVIANPETLYWFEYAMGKWRTT